jgi:putative ABC transport system substrate-binding protein
VDRRRFLLTSLAGALAEPLAVGAQQAGKVWRIGLLTLAPPGDAAPNFMILEGGLRDLGYIEGRNIVFERRYALGRLERLPDLAAELVRLRVDVIVAGSNADIAAARRATTTIPIVTVHAEDPVEAGFIASQPHPGGNITGLGIGASTETEGKRLQMLQEIVPKLSPGRGSPPSGGRIGRHLRGDGGGSAKTQPDARLH